MNLCDIFSSQTVICKEKAIFCVKEKILKLDEIRNIIIYIEYTK